MKTSRKPTLAVASLVLFLCLILWHSANNPGSQTASQQAPPSLPQRASPTPTMSQPSAPPELASCAQPFASPGSDDNSTKAFESLDQTWALAPRLWEKDPSGVEYADYLVHLCQTATEVRYEKRAQEACQKAFDLAVAHFHPSVVMTKRNHHIDCFYAVVQEKVAVEISGRDPCLALNLLVKMATPDEANCRSRFEIEALMDDMRHFN
jgi:hypothetical protein